MSEYITRKNKKDPEEFESKYIQRKKKKINLDEIVSKALNKEDKPQYITKKQKFITKKTPEQIQDRERMNRASGGRMASKPELIERLLEKTKLAGVDIPSSSETNEVDNDLKLILDEVEKQKGEISNLKQIIKKQKAEQ